jgi:hypothetical protein
MKKKFVFVNEEQNMKIQSSKVVKTKKWLRNTGAQDKDFRNFHSFSTKSTTKPTFTNRQLAESELEKAHLSSQILNSNYQSKNLFSLNSQNPTLGCLLLT